MRSHHALWLFSSLFLIACSDDSITVQVPAGYAPASKIEEISWQEKAAAIERISLQNESLKKIVPVQTPPKKIIAKRLKAKRLIAKAIAKKKKMRVANRY